MPRINDSLPTRPAGLAPEFHSAGDSLRHLSSGELHDVLVTTKREIKAIRGWHGSRLAVAGGVVGGAAAVTAGVTAVGAATVFTAGVATPFIIGGAVALGAVAAGGGAAGGVLKTSYGRAQCKQNAALMSKIELLTHMRNGLKARKAELSGEERALYHNIKHVVKKVDGGSLKEVGMNAAKTTGAAAGVVVASAAVATAVVLAAAAAGGGGEMGCGGCYGGGDMGGGGCGCGGGGGSLVPPENRLGFAGISVTETNLAMLRAAAVELPEEKKRS